MARGHFEAALFDLGGTLYSYRNMGVGNLEMLREALARLGVEQDVREAAEVYRQASRDAFAEFVPRPFYLHRDVFFDAFRRFVQGLGAAPDEEFLEWLYVAQRRVIVESVELRPGCRATLEGLRADGLHVGIVSNIDDDHLLPMLQRAKLAQSVDAWTSSEEAGSCKPDAGIFRYALEKAGTAPERTLFVGDSREQDVAGARALGMRAVLLEEPGVSPPGAGAREAGEPHHVIAQLPEVLAIARPRAYPA
jgi:HAD superfamily hydrolase (TIGR01509 family)